MNAVVTDNSVYSLEELLQFGFLNLDKPADRTSHTAIQNLRKLLGAKKVGHSGTLDPAVTGCLPTGFGKATRLLQYVLESGKKYDCLMRLHEEISEDGIRDGLKKMEGVITQMPPLRSRVKRQLRQRNVYGIYDVQINGKDVYFGVHCQAGTYIRKLCHDFGEALGCGAHMAKLRRTQAGPFTEESAVTLECLADMKKKEADFPKRLKALFHPPEFVLGALPYHFISRDEEILLCHGAPLPLPETRGEELCAAGEIAIFGEEKKLLGIGYPGPHPLKGEMAILPKKVFIP